MGESKGGVIYILTNPSFPEYVKIGYAEDIKERLKALNRSECIPFAFRVYATYEVPKLLSDKEVHKVIDMLNPNLRAIDSFDGKKRTKEFFAIPAEDAYALLKAMAEIHGCKDKLHLFNQEEHEIEDQQVADEVREEAKERKEPFSFSKCGIPVGSEIVYGKRKLNKP